MVDCEFSTTANESPNLYAFISIAGKISGKHYIQNQRKDGYVKITAYSATDATKVLRNRLNIKVR